MTLLACARQAIDALDADAASRSLTALGPADAAHHRCASPALALAALSLGTRHATGARTALRLARVVSGETAVGLLYTPAEEDEAAEAALAADAADDSTYQAGGVVLPALPEEEAAGRAGEAEAATPSSVGASLWRVCTMASATAAACGDARLADEAAAWASALPRPTEDAVTSLLDHLGSAGSGMRLPLSARRGGRPLLPESGASGGFAWRRAASHALVAAARRQAAENRLLARATSGDGPAVLRLVRDAAFAEGRVERRNATAAAAAAAAGDGAEAGDGMKGPAGGPGDADSLLLPLLDWELLREAGSVLAGEGAARAFGVADAVEGGESPARAQGAAATAQVSVLSETFAQMLLDADLAAPPGAAATPQGVSAHALARCLQVMCHTAEGSPSAAALVNLVSRTLADCVPEAARAAAADDARRSMTAVRLSRALVACASLGHWADAAAQAAAADDVIDEGAGGGVGPEPAAAAPARRGLGGAVASRGDGLTAAGPGGAAAEGVLACVRDEDGEPSSRLAVTVATSRPDEALAAVEAVRRALLADGAGSDDDPATAAALAAIGNLEGSDRARAGEDGTRAPAPREPYPAERAVADAAGAAVASLAAPRSFVGRGTTRMMRAVTSLHRQGLASGPRAREHVVAFFARVGLLGNAFAVAGSMAADPAIRRAGSEAWASHGLPLEAAMHLLRATALRGDGDGAARALGLVRAAAEAEGEDIPAEAHRLAKRVAVAV